MLKGGLSNMLQTFERDARFYLNAILFLFSFISFLFIPPSFFCKQSTQRRVFSKNQFIADCSRKCETFNNNDLKLGLKILLSNSQICRLRQSQKDSKSIQQLGRISKNLVIICIIFKNKNKYVDLNRHKKALNYNISTKRSHASKYHSILISIIFASNTMKKQSLLIDHVVCFTQSLLF